MTITIFIADDHRIMRQGLAQVLALQPDMEVIGMAGDGREALAQVALLKPSIVIMDINMPGMNGIEAVRQLLEKAPAARIVMLSMHSTAEHFFTRSPPAPPVTSSRSPPARKSFTAFGKYMRAENSSIHWQRPF